MTFRTMVLEFIWVFLLNAGCNVVQTTSTSVTSSAGYDGHDCREDNQDAKTCAELGITEGQESIKYGQRWDCRNGCARWIGPASFGSDTGYGFSYPQCKPQTTLHPEIPAITFLEGKEFDRSKQISPGFLDDMAQCNAGEFEIVKMKIDEIKMNAQVVAKLDDEKNCVWEAPAEGNQSLNQILQCHFHSAPEFLWKTNHPNLFGKDLASTKDDLVDGELHCVFPDATKVKPTVFGLHVRCKERSLSTSSARGQCSVELLNLFASCQNQNFYCCENGSLTKPYPKMSEAQMNTRPNFRMCSDVVEEIDCSLLDGMEAHGSNAVDVGPEYQGVFMGSMP